MIDNRWFLYDREDDNLLNHLCAIRGLDPKQLEPDFSKDLHNPDLLPDMQKAVSLIKQARKNNWLVTIFGDYDADGTPAAALLSTVFDRLKIKHQVVLPTRKTGYGLNVKTIKTMAQKAQLLITVDTGITAVEEITLAKDLGLKVIVIDHHLPGKTLPPADALVDPFVSGSTYPFNGLCGCALAYKLTVALSREFPQQLTEGFCKWLLDLVAISTVADMMPLINENRALVHYGLKVLAKTKRPGLDELMKVAGIAKDSLTSYSLGFAIGPRLNAAGRLSDNRPAYDLIKATNIQEAASLARQLNEANHKRQQLVRSLTEEIQGQIWIQNKKDDYLVVVTGDSWPTGILGLVAGKLSTQINKPAVVLTTSDKGLVGSGRSPGHYSLIEGLEHSTKYLTGFGGHNLAAGLSTSKEKLPKFIDTIKAHAKKNIKKEDLVPRITIDAQIKEEEINDSTVESIKTLAPFGFGNPNPVILVTNIELSLPRSIGAKNNHLKARGRVGKRELDIIGFGLAKRYFDDPLTKIDVVGNLEHNTWLGTKTLQFKVKDFRHPNSRIDGTLPLPG